MNKLIAVGVLALAGLSGIGSTASAKGNEMTLGLAGGVATHNSGGYADIYFQYTIAPHVRIAPEVGYIFRNSHHDCHHHDCNSGFEFSVDMHFPFRLAKGFNLYPLTGITLNSWDREHTDNLTRVGADFGAGFDIYLTSTFKLSLQGKYSLMDDCSGGFFNVGFGYVF